LANHNWAELTTNLQLSFDTSKHSEISASHQQSVECFGWRSGVCCWGPRDSVFEIVATYSCCKQLENPKLTALFVCLFVCLIDWLIWIFIRTQQYFCSLEIYNFQNAQFLFRLLDSAATSS
jgi:hypothetical protein